MRGCVGTCVRGCVRACVGAWVRGCVGAWVRGCVGAWVRGCVRAWVRGCADACCFELVFSIITNTFSTVSIINVMICLEKMFLKIISICVLPCFALSGNLL